MLDWLRRKTTHNTPNGLVAASATISNISKVTKRVVKGEGWESSAWAAVRSVPEVSYGVRWKANGVSRARLFAGEPDIDGSGSPVPTDNEVVQQVVEQLYGGQAAQSEMLYRMATLREVIGEWCLVMVETSDGERRWAVTSRQMLFRHSANAAVQFEPNGSITELDDSTSRLIWYWQPDGQNPLYPDSPVRSIIPVAQQIMKLDARINAVAESRSTGNGLLVIPEGTTVANPGLGEGNADTGDEFVEALMDAMLTPIQDPESAAAVVPVVATVPSGEEGDIRHLTFSSDFNDQVLDIRTSAIRRIAIGLDIPEEIITGMEQRSASRYTMWAVSEDAVKLNIEPVLEAISSVLTSQYLHPILKEMQVADYQKYVIWYDISELVLRPNRGPEARELYDKKLLSGEATRRESGFSEADAPSPQELVSRLIEDIIVANPQLAPQLMPEFARVVGLSGDLPDITGGSVRREIRSGSDNASIPSMTEARGSTPSERPESTAVIASTRIDVERRIFSNGQVLIAEMAAKRALERVGNFLFRGVKRTDRSQFETIPKWELHTIVDATQCEWDKATTGAYDLLADSVPESPCLVETVNSYVQRCVTSGTKYSRDDLVRVLLASGCVGDERA